MIHAFGKQVKSYETYLHLFENSGTIIGDDDLSIRAKENESTRKLVHEKGLNGKVSTLPS